MKIIIFLFIYATYAFSESETIESVPYESLQNIIKEGTIINIFTHFTLNSKQSDPLADALTQKYSTSGLIVFNDGDKKRSLLVTDVFTAKIYFDHCADKTLTSAHQSGKNYLDQYSCKFK